MANPLIPNQKETLNEAYNKCLQTVKLGSPVKLGPLIQFFKGLALLTREKQEKSY
jgi:hypothetical protein